PGVAPRRIDRVVSAIDAAPTALALLGFPSPSDFEGADRSALARSSAAAPGAPGCAFSAATSAGAPPSITAYSARETGWKLIYRKAAGTFQLVDLARDPRELEDASEREPEKTLDLTQKLLR